MTVTLLWRALCALTDCLDEVLFEALLLLFLALWCVPLLAAAGMLAIPIGLHKLTVWAGLCEAT